MLTTFVPEIATLKANMTQKTPRSFVMEQVIMEENVLNLYNYVNLSINVIFLNKLPYAVRAAWKIKFTTFQYIPTHKKFHF